MLFGNSSKMNGSSELCMILSHFVFTYAYFSYDSVMYYVVIFKTIGEYSSFSRRLPISNLAKNSRCIELA